MKRYNLNVTGVRRTTIRDGQLNLTLNQKCKNYTIVNANPKEPERRLKDG